MNISRVYKIVNDCDDLVYIGSTTQILCKRMSNHRDDVKRGSDRKIHKHMRDVGFAHFKIILVREYKDISKERLFKKEDKYIKRYDTVRNGLNAIYAFGQTCEHKKPRGRCVECQGSEICEHDKQKTRCRHCGGSDFCEHNKYKQGCRECGGSQVCEHDKHIFVCKLCGGRGICEHNKQKSKCKLCNPSTCRCGKTYAGKQSLKNHQIKCQVEQTILTE